MSRRRPKGDSGPRAPESIDTATPAAQVMTKRLGSGKQACYFGWLDLENTSCPSRAAGEVRSTNQLSRSCLTCLAGWRSACGGVRQFTALHS